MRKRTTFLTGLFWGAIFLGSSQAGAQALSLTWKDAQGNAQQGSARVVNSDLEGRQVIYLAFPSPSAQAKAAGFLEAGTAEETPVEELPVVPVKPRGEQKFLLLWHKAGKIKILNEDGTHLIFSYELAPVKSFLQLSASCRKLQFKVKTVTEDQASFPAMVNCKMNGNMVEELTFSTLEEAGWFGSQAFENAGKGERWKSFVFKDISTLGIWEVSWGSPETKAVGKVLIPKTNKKIPIPPKPALTFMAGAQYLMGKASSPTKEADLGGVQIPLSVQYHKDGAWWFLGSGYDFFVYSTTSSAAGSNSLSNLGAWGGGEYKSGALALRGSVGYLSRALTVPDVGITSTFEAPRLGVDVHYALGSALLGLEAVMAQTSTEGTFEETTFKIFYQTKLLFSKETRFQFVNTSLKASTPAISVEAQWMSLGVAIQF